MDRGNDTYDPDKPLFVAELVPYRSLGRKGFRVFFLIVGILTFGHGLFFFLTGAWPVMIFFGLDFSLLYGAFYLNYRSGRAKEEVSVARTDVSIRKYSPSGKMVEHHFNPFWARFHVKRHSEIGIVSMNVTGEGKHTDIGSFLNPDDRETFAAAFKTALATVKMRL